MNRHCEERSDEAIQYGGDTLDCFAGARNDGWFTCLLNVSSGIRNRTD